MDEATEKIDALNIEKGKEKITEAKDMLNHRQKIIQLADSSEFGWRLVKEYEAHRIASDSDDEKKIFKAEVRPTRKIKSEKSKRGHGSYRAWPYRQRPYMGQRRKNPDYALVVLFRDIGRRTALL